MKKKKVKRLCDVIVPYITENLRPYIMRPPIRSCGGWGQSQFQLGGMMSLPIRYPPMASYFRLSIIFLTPQTLRHAPHRCNPPRPSHDHHRLYPIPFTPLVWYHIGDLPYDPWTTLLYFPFLVSFLLPDTFCCNPTDHRSLHHAIRTLPYVSPHMNLVLILLIICI